MLRMVRAALGAVGAVSPGLAARAAMRLFSTPRRFARPAREREALKDARPLPLRAGVGAHAWGGDGPIVLLVHGWEGRGTQLAAFVDPLVDAGYRVVALDGPAHGDAPGRTTDVLEYAHALLRVGEELGPVAAVVAHSFGVAATTIALSRGMRVARVVLIAGPASLHEVVDRAVGMMGLSDRTARRFHALLRERVGHEMEIMDVAGMGSRLQVPALVVHDVDDAEVPFADAATLAARWPGARLKSVHGHGHRRILRADEVVRGAVEFIAEGSGAPRRRRRRAG